MDEEKRTCKTCHHFGEHVNYCHLHDSSHAEWDTCPDHETYEEFIAKRGKPGDRILNNKFDQEADVMYINFYFPALEADDSQSIGDTILRFKDGEIIGVTVMNWRKSYPSKKEKMDE